MFVIGAYVYVSRDVVKLPVSSFLFYFLLFLEVFDRLRFRGKGEGGRGAREQGGRIMRIGMGEHSNIDPLNYVLCIVQSTVVRKGDEGLVVDFFFLLRPLANAHYFRFRLLDT